MPHSLRAELKGLNYKKILTDRELERLCKALDNEKVLEQISDDIEREADYQDAYVNADVAKGLYMALDIIDKCKSEEGD